MGLIILNNASGATKVYCVFQTSLPDLKSIHTKYLSKHFSTKRLRTFVEKAREEAKVPITCLPRTNGFLGKSLSRYWAIFPRMIAFGKEPSETDEARNASATERRAHRLRKLGALLTPPLGAGEGGGHQRQPLPLLPGGSRWLLSTELSRL